MIIYDHNYVSYLKSFDFIVKIKQSNFLYKNKYNHHVNTLNKYYLIDKRLIDDASTFGLKRYI